MECESFGLILQTANFVQNHPNLFDNEHKLQFYGLYKLASGKCNTDRPGGLLN